MNNEARVFMNKFCVLSKNQDTYFIKRLSNEVGKEALVVTNPFIESVLPGASHYLVRTTGVYHSDKDLQLLRNVKLDGVVNPLEVLEVFRGKISQYEWFNKHKIEIPPYLDLAIAQKEDIESFFQTYPKVVIKPNFGQGGWGVRMIEKEESFKISQSSDKAYLLQPFIDGEEIRYFFIKGKEPFIQKRIPTTGIAANFQSGGISEITTLERGLRTQIERVVSLSGAIYGAIDCFRLEDKVLFLELNTVPGIEQAEKVSNRNLIKELLSVFNN